MRSVHGIALAVLLPLIAGCAGSTTQSQYAGMPRHLLPRDHFEYRPLRLASRDPRQRQQISQRTRLMSSVEFSLDDEDKRLRNVMNICRNCGSIVSAPPTYDGAESLAEHDAAVARKLREIERWRDDEGK
jgi:hypothetical protein